MKEITRRLYTKPVMIGMALLLGTVLAVGLFVTTKSTAAPAAFIAHGDDEFETTGNGETYHNFAASPVPAGFFGTNSKQYTGVVPLVGVPLDPNVSDVDTVIHRNQDVWTPGTTTIKMTALSLEGINPITVTFTDSTPPQTWYVKVGLSSLKQSTGSMSIGSGGTFDSTLKVYPKFTFTRNGDEKVLDTGGSGLAATADASAAAVEFDIGDTEIEPNPLPQPKPCAVAIDVFEGQTRLASGGANAAAIAPSGCPPVTLTSTNSPWTFCNGVFCIPRPLTEAELLAAHNASPKGTKKQQQVAQ